MRRICVSISLMIVCFLIPACAKHGGLSKHDLGAMPSIEIVRHKTPELEAKTVTGAVIKHAVKGPLGGLAGHAYGKTTLSTMAGDKVLPDYGEMLVRKFADRARSEVPGWPETTVREEPVQKRFDPRGHSVMEFRIKELGVSTTRGFVVNGSVSIKKSSHDKGHSQHFKYQGSSQNRMHPLEAYFADDGKILMEEFSFSADYIVTELIKSLQNQPADLSRE